MPMETHVDLCHASNEPFLILLAAICLVTDLWPPHRWWSQSLWPVLLNCLRPSWFQKETLEPADVGFSLAFHYLRQSLLALCDSLPVCTQRWQLLLSSEGFSWLVPWVEAPWEMAVTVKQWGFQLASTLGGGTLGTDYPVSSLTRPSPWKRPDLTCSCQPDTQERILLNGDLFNMKYPKILLCDDINKVLHNLDRCQIVFFW